MPKKYKLNGGKSSVSYDVWIHVMAQPRFQENFTRFLAKCRDYINATIEPKIERLNGDDIDGLDKIEASFCIWASNLFKMSGFGGDYMNGLDGNRDITDKILNSTDDIHADWFKIVHPTSGGKMVVSTQSGIIGRPLHLMGGTLTGGNIVDDWISKLGITFGNIGKKIGNFVNDNQDLFVTILVDLLMCVVAPEISIVDFAGSIASVATTIAKYSMKGPPSQQISEDEANNALYVLMADPRWNDDLVQPTIDYCKIILGYILKDPAPCESLGANQKMTFDIHGLFKQWSGLVETSSYGADGTPLNGRQASGIIIVGYSNATNKTLTHPIIFDPSIQNNYEMKIWSVHGNEWRKGQSANAALGTLWANYDYWEERLRTRMVKAMFNDPVARANYQFAQNYFFGPPQPPFQLNNGADIYPKMDALIANLPLGEQTTTPTLPTPLVPAPPKPTNFAEWNAYLQKYGNKDYPPPGTYDPNVPTTPTTAPTIPAPPKPKGFAEWNAYIKKYGTKDYPPPGTYVDDY